MSLLLNQSGGEDVPLVRNKHLRTTLKTTRPSVSDNERRRHEKIYADFLKSRGDLVSTRMTKTGASVQGAYNIHVNL